jgi:diguanylate cyclase (GGDEF)-like protein/PAS domain S-box-containing protein
MNDLHSLLKRQLRRFADGTIPLLEEQTGFITAINDAYWQFDADRKLLEHSLELTSQELLERNAELSRINADLERRVLARTAELSASETRFRGLFEHAPVSIWEEDFSAVRQYTDRLRATGIVDFSAYFDAHPEAIAECAARVKIVDVNHATLELYQAESKAQLLADLSKVLGPESLTPFREELLALAGGDMIFETEIINYTLRGKKLVVFVRLTVAPGYEQTWAKVFVGISDITERRQMEAALATERDLLQALMDNIPDTIYFKDTASRFTRINRAQVKVLGVATPEEAIGKTDLDFFHKPELAQGFYQEEQRLVETGEALINRVEFNPTPDGQPRWFSATKVPVKDEAGRVTGIVGISRDITERKQIEEALGQSEERFKLMSWATKDAVWDWDLHTNQVWWGEGLQKIFHYSSETVQTNSDWWFDHIHPEDQAKVHRTIEQALEDGMEFWSKEYRFQRKDGTYADMMARGYIMRDDAASPYRMIGAMIDITERKYMESTLLQANEQMGQLLNEMQQRNHEIALLNQMSHLLQACQTEEEAYRIIAKLANQLFPNTAGALYLLNPSRTLVSSIASWGELPSAQRMFAPDDCWALHRDQIHVFNADEAEPHCIHLAEPLPIATCCLPIQVQDEKLGILHLQSMSKENLGEPQRQLAYTIVEQARMALSNLKLREALREQSIRDPLTGLYNRRYMDEALKQQLSRVTRQLHPLGIIMIDIDHFKLFNDTYGHAAGDALLRELGQFLQSHIRAEDIACRYGGEEFTLILPDASREVAQQRAEHLRQEARHLRLQGVSQFPEAITLSVGVAVYPENGRTIEIVLRAADAALYRAKQEGRDRVAVAEKAC